MRPRLSCLALFTGVLLTLPHVVHAQAPAAVVPKADPLSVTAGAKVTLTPPSGAAGSWACTKWTLSVTPGGPTNVQAPADGKAGDSDNCTFGAAPAIKLTIVDKMTLKAEPASLLPGESAALLAYAGDNQKAPIDGAWTCDVGNAGEMRVTTGAVTTATAFAAAKDAKPGAKIKCEFTPAAATNRAKDSVTVLIVAGAKVSITVDEPRPGAKARLNAVDDKNMAVPGSWTCDGVQVSVTAATGAPKTEEFKIPADAKRGSQIKCTFTDEAGKVQTATLTVSAAFHANASVDYLTPGAIAALRAVDETGVSVEGTWTCNPADAGVLVPSATNSTATFTAASSVKVGMTVTCIFKDSVQGIPATISLQVRSSVWEYRSVLGFQQSAAASSDPKAAYFFDFFIMRGFGCAKTIFDKQDPSLCKDHAGDANAQLSQWNVWGNVRLATAPIQTNVSLADFVKAPAAGTTSLTANQLVQGAEFLTGVERMLMSWSDNKTTRRNLGVVVAFGASGPYSPKQAVSVFELPGVDAKNPVSPALNQLFLDQDSDRVQQLKDQGFSKDNPPKYLALTIPDTQQFYKKLLAGVRIETYDLENRGNPPGTYMVTVGWDQAVTGHLFRSPVANFDVFYPLPLDLGKGYHFIYLFATATMSLGPTTTSAPVFLNEANVPPSTPGTGVISIATRRDVYRIGVGLDLLSALSQLKLTSK